MKTAELLLVLISKDTTFGLTDLKSGILGVSQDALVTFVCDVVTEVVPDPYHHFSPSFR